jgi:Mrp family chromosome partitioning ATPase
VNAQPNSAVHLEKTEIAPMFPNRAQAKELRWSPLEARQRLVYGFDSRNAQSRSFNLIRSKLVALHRERGWRMLGVVSATPSVGKSFVSSNLAAAMSRDPRYQTYLVDLDLRRGTIQEIFGIEAESTLSEYLTHAQAASTLTGFVPQGQELLIIPSAPAEVHSAELLAGERGTALFREMRQSDEGHFFVCDLPPVFANDDASIIMESLDGYVIVAQDGKTTQREIEDVVGLLGHERLAGAVLNKYRGGLVSEGYGVDDRYASYYGRSPDHSATDV